jgi:hypothetical protein
VVIRGHLPAIVKVTVVLPVTNRILGHGNEVRDLYVYDLWLYTR